MGDLLLILAAAFFGGLLNAAAGGGSFLTLPALIYIGLPPVAANATGTVALLPGYVFSAFGFREDIRLPSGLTMTTLLLASLAGGSLGAGLLLITPNATFQVLIPWLLIAATFAFLVGPRLVAARTQHDASRVTWIFGVLAVAVYGGYFNGGLGIVLLALFSLLGVADLNAANGLKNLVSAMLTLIAVMIYASGGVVYWFQALIMMLAASVGGYVGARWVRQIPAVYVRCLVVCVGFVMALLFFVNQAAG